MKWLAGLREKWRGKGMEIVLVLAAAALALGMLMPQAETAKVAGQVARGENGALEDRLGAVLSQMTGAGRVEVVIQYAREAYASDSWFSTQPEADGGRPSAVIVVAEGAADVQVRLRLARAVQTLLGLDAENVEVFEMRKGE